MQVCEVLFLQNKQVTYSNILKECTKDARQIMHIAQTSIMCNNSPLEQFFVPFGCTGKDHLFLQERQNIEVSPFHVQLLQKHS